METWEVVLILALVTVSVLVLVQKDMSMSFIRVLDNTFFQLAILTGALAVATISPAVAIVAIATIVVVFYVRNLVKIHIVVIVRKSCRRLVDDKLTSSLRCSSALEL